jgi:hypothetical protein
MKQVTKKQAKYFRHWMFREHPEAVPRMNWYYMPHKILAYADRKLERIGVDLDDFSAWAFMDRAFFRKQLDNRPDSLQRVTMHEWRHVYHMRKMGVQKWQALYIASEKWRRKIEANGYAGNLLVERWQGKEPNWDRYEDKLSRYMLSPKHIRKAIKDLKDYDRKTAQDPKKNHMFWCWEQSGAENI